MARFLAAIAILFSGLFLAHRLSAKEPDAKSTIEKKLDLIIKKLIELEERVANLERLTSQDSQPRIEPKARRRRPRIPRVDPKSTTTEASNGLHPRPKRVSVPFFL